MCARTEPSAVRGGSRAERSNEREAHGKTCEHDGTRVGEKAGLPGYTDRPGGSDTKESRSPPHPARPLAVGAGPASLSVVWSNQPAGSPFATVDALSNGRAEVILGRGSFTESFPLFGYDLADYDVLF